MSLLFGPSFRRPGATAPASLDKQPEGPSASKRFFDRNLDLLKRLALGKKEEKLVELFISTCEDLPQPNKQSLKARIASLREQQKSEKDGVDAKNLEIVADLLNSLTKDWKFARQGGLTPLAWDEWKTLVLGCLENKDIEGSTCKIAFSEPPTFDVGQQNYNGQNTQYQQQPNYNGQNTQYQQQPNYNGQNTQYQQPNYNGHNTQFHQPNYNGQNTQFQQHNNMQENTPNGNQRYSTVPTGQQQTTGQRYAPRYGNGDEGNCDDE